MKKLFLIPLVILLVGGLIFGGCAAPAPAPAPVAPAPGPEPTPVPGPAAPAPAPAAKPIVLKGVSFLPLFLTANASIIRYAETVNERANGELIIDWIGGPEAIPPPDQPEALRTGTVDMLMTCTPYYEAVLPEAVGLHLSEYTAIEERESGFHDLLVELHKEKMNAYYLGRTQIYAPFYMFTNFPVKKPQDLANYTCGGTALWMPFMRALDMVPVHTMVQDLYTSLERGVIDSYVLPGLTAEECGLVPVSKYLINHGFYETNNLTVTVNLDVWNQIPKHLQDLMNEVMIELEPWELEFWYTCNKEGLKRMRDAGVEFVEFSPEEGKWYRDLAYSSSWEDFEAKVSPEMLANLKAVMLK